MTEKLTKKLITFDHFEIALRGTEHKIVKNVSFDINRDETLCIVGESGSGKSITALSILGLLPPALQAGGKIEFKHRNILEHSEQDLTHIRGRDISMIFQEPMTSLNPVLKVGTQIAEPLVLHSGLNWHAADKEALRLLELVRIPDSKTRLNAYPHELSGGMRQRVVIAMALACQPSLLIADEPTTALDVTIQAEILDLMRDLKQDIGMAVLFITHDLGVVAEIADRVVVMRGGTLIEQANVNNLFQSPQQLYTRNLLSSVPRLGSLAGTPLPKKFAPQDCDLDDADIPCEPDLRSETILDVSNMSTRFHIHGGVLKRITGFVPAVQNISFAIRRGETLSLVGESGCGKSTVARSILQLSDESTGSVRFLGREIHGVRTAEATKLRNNIQMIFQDPFGSLNPRQSVSQCLSELLRVHNLVPPHALKDRIIELLEMVGLHADHANRYPHEFSGGQRQRICIARCLGMHPKLIIADESVSALDTTIKAQVINLMLELQRRFGVSFLFISHDIGAVERISHRVAVMLRGEIVEIGARAAVLGNPQHDYTRRLIAAVPIADPSAKRKRHRLSRAEVGSRVKPNGWTPALKQYAQVGEDHFVQQTTS